MKRIFGILILSALFALTINANAADTLRIGENEPCKTGYYYIDFTGPNLLTYTDECGCIYIIEYYYRTTADGNRLEVNITNIFKVTDCGNCKIDMKIIYQEALVRIWNVNDMGADKGRTIYQTSKKSCQYLVADSGPGFVGDMPIIQIQSEDISMLEDFVPVLLPVLPATNTLLTFDVFDYIAYCDDDICCEMFYTIVWDADDKIDTLSWYDPGMGNQDSCSGPSECTASCDWLYFNYGKNTGANKRAALQNGDSKIKIIPNPNSGHFNLSINGIESGKYKLVIIDLLGNEALRADLNISHGSIEKELLLEVTHGTYIYRLEKDNTLKYTGKIIVN